ncbi:hypothetical protein IWX90DRAFT_476436 [Phyllosticta citrichinensis]|uniref:H15 domain-containing protein n=1 Tax=Phyllosticta citrichinensis TaxID=1130410 RepID=A0ABR1XZY1_9PEZI
MSRRPWPIEDKNRLLLGIVKDANVKLSDAYCKKFEKFMGNRYSPNAIRKQLAKILSDAEKSGLLCEEDGDRMRVSPKRKASPRRAKTKKIKVEKSSDDESLDSPPIDDSATLDASPPRRLPERAKRASVSYRELAGDTEGSSDTDFVKLRSDVLEDCDEV